MQKSSLIIGKDFPNGSSYLTTAIDSLRNAVITKAPDVELKTEAETQCAKWNRTSPISARSLVVRAEAETSLLDEAIIIFDENQYASKFIGLDVETFSKADDELIRGYLYVVSEILTRFLKKNHGHLVFLAKESSTEQNISIAVQVAYKNFITLAETIAKQYLLLPVPKITLVKATEENDDEIAQWIFKYLDEIDNLGEKAKKRNTIHWLKPGEKVQKKLF